MARSRPLLVFGINPVFAVLAVLGYLYWRRHH